VTFAAAVRASGLKKEKREKKLQVLLPVRASGIIMYI
jgi:hypothetical protein